MNILLASLVSGICAAISAWLVLSVIFAERTNRGMKHKFETERRDIIRESSFAFRQFEPAIDELAAMLDKNEQPKHQELGEYLAASGEKLPWKPTEFIATKMIEAVIAAIVTFGFMKMLAYSTVFAAIMACGMGYCYVWMAKSSVKKKANRRRGVIKRTFASAIDLLALMMEVGGSFQESLKIVARENAGKDLGDELSLIVNDIEMGKPRKYALENFGNRMNDDDISEVIFACNESEELGVPIADTLKLQADRIRGKRTSWAEKAAQEAEVTLVFPSMLIMLACLVTVGAPFILQGLSTFLGGL